MEFSDELWAEVGYVTISKNRGKVMKILSDGPKIPSQIGRQAGIRTNHVSDNLKQLSEHGLVECINPEARKGRLYRLTEKGKMVVEKI